MAEHVTIVEVGPRDGLQNEPGHVPTATKIALIDALSQAGFTRIEAASFVSPKWVPQMADGAEVMAGIARRPGTRYAALTPNIKGFQRALEAGVDEVAIFAAASETFSARNINATVDESIDRFAPVAEAARTNGIPLRGYVSCATDCPYEGEIAPEAPARVAERLFALGCFEVSLADTIGKGRPERVAAMLDAALAIAAPETLAGHFHDTGNRALANVRVALEKGLRVFDSAIGGLGGCPFAPGAKGNLSTIALHDMLCAEGWETGLDRAKLEAAETIMRGIR